jgi:hypothetical protein
MLALLGMVIIAIANGIIRENFYSQSMSELSAHQLSTLISIILFGILHFCSYWSFSNLIGETSIDDW